MKEISLTRGMVALVDDADYTILNHYKWYSHKQKCGTYYATRNSPSLNGKRKTIYMHSEIIYANVGLEIDHINGNGLDNRRINLRAVPHRINAQNLHVLKTSKYPGVHWSKERMKWRSKIIVNGKYHHLGMFDNEYDAYLRYADECDAIALLRGDAEP